MSGPLSEHNKLAVPTGVNWKVLTAAFLPRVMFRGGHSCRARLFLEDGKLLENLERMRHTDSSRSSIPRPMHGMHLGCGIRYAFYSSHISVLPSSLVLGISHTRMPVRVRVWWSVDCGFGSHRHTLHLRSRCQLYGYLWLQCKDTRSRPTSQSHHRRHIFTKQPLHNANELCFRLSSLVRNLPLAVLQIYPILFTI